METELRKVTLIIVIMCGMWHYVTVVAYNAKST